ncbi:hypothetical protein MNEG_1457 [Monoraphidium neglectum]|uniref:Uncharacterized protein n=1 Tax=Monoraphidium neglectum TaxID=145388 RepID=A0A0D2K8E7_9CHLO|nr:hypothetical protein MNEG_1457 [Monoraphidium neglectum]KIZ06493.1 hypothetical protein MNEG_1457 [Monoraphidium neglectum]|eukprot:XP_013905512.1 hypothetical protein MNEG_1457 [Monoraphidium neglectum]
MPKERGGSGKGPGSAGVGYLRPKQQRDSQGVAAGAGGRASAKPPSLGAAGLRRAAVVRADDRDLDDLPDL